MNSLSADVIEAYADSEWKSGLLKESLICYKHLASFQNKVAIRHIHFKLGILYLLTEKYESAFGEFGTETNESCGNSEEKMETLAGSGFESISYLDSRIQEAAVKACAWEELDELEKLFPEFQKQKILDLDRHGKNNLRITNLNVMAAMALTYRRYSRVGSNSVI
uniref:AlNc14C117G6562 protein n=1 Tax=Albugo laibachii Nc14 TaxID=890382 RepID=F0WJ31_9STRA|nr:AlNc14C117G6562 [Albugo laibachii Nc14]|eukprot:CCA21277.1 AlNc14C117G6562 [Albugo laibachii Nc14]